MSDNDTRGGIGIAPLMFLIFMTLKLCHVIDWSWWWVTCPIWSVVALLIFLEIMKEIAYRFKK